MNRITRIEIAGYRSLDKPASLDLTPLTVLIGANGAGKSTVLSAFEHFGGLIKDSIQDQLPLDLPPTAGQNPTDRNPLRITVSTGEDAWTVAAPRLGEATRPLDDPPRWTDDAKRWRVLTCPDVRHRTASPAYRSTVVSGDAMNLAGYLMEMQAQEPVAFQRIQDSLRLAVPDVRHLNPVKVPGTDYDPPWVELGWTDADGNDRGPAELSAGTLRFLALASVLQAPDAWLPRVVLLDEPETSMNPYSVTLAAAMMKAASNRTTVVAATQSPILLDELTVDDVVTMEPPGPSQAATFYRHTQHDVKTLLEDYSLSELWQKNVLGGRQREG
ncbi:MAG: AAA family ATPase [Acidobacteria bacterium]|nr:AAA family ATPase [Acidobacteriota bacterium]